MTRFCIAAALAVVAMAQSVLNGQVVISQVYGGGGNSGATYTHDFIEIFNKGNAPVSIAGWSVQQGSATNAGWNNNGVPTPIGTGAVTILQPGQYYLIQESQGAGGTTPLPTPDAIGVITMGATSGKVALVNNTTPLTGACPTDPAIMDVVGYGATANCSETSPTAAPSNTNAVKRNNGGCDDTGNNNADFTVTAPTPRNSASPFGSCAGTPPTAVANAANPDPVCTGAQVILSATVTPGTSPASTGLSVIVNLGAIGGSTTQAFFDDGPGGGHGDATAGDNVFTFNPTISPTVSAGVKNLAGTVSDAQLRSSNFTITINQVDRCQPTANAIVSPVALCTTGGTASILVFVTPATTGGDAIQSVTADLSSIGLSPTQSLFDDGTNGDENPGDNTWTYEFTVGALSAGAYNIPFSGVDADPRNFSGNAAFNIVACTSAAPSMVISQVYGGGGNTGATYLNDYVELFNRSASPVDIGGWSLQYASSIGNFQTLLKVDLPVSPVIVQPGQYYLVQQASGGLIGAALPTPDHTGTVNMSGTTGKIALVNNTTVITNCSDASVVDVVGYGSDATCFEGAFYALSGNNSRAMYRQLNGCQDNNQNAPDFFRALPVARNTASPFNVCSIAPTCSCRADTNGDTLVNGKDVQAFAACVIAGVFNQPCACADANNDAAVTTADISAFVTAALAGACAP